MMREHEADFAEAPADRGLPLEAVLTEQPPKRRQSTRSSGCALMKLKRVRTRLRSWAAVISNLAEGWSSSLRRELSPSMVVAPRRRGRGRQLVMKPRKHEQYVGRSPASCRGI
jgi:hypothetical protein